METMGGQTWHVTALAQSRTAEHAAPGPAPRIEPADLPPGEQAPPPAVAATPPGPPLRLAVLLAFIMICVALLAWRLFYWQVLEHERLQKQAVSEQVREQILRPQAGMIYDSNGHILATSMAADFVVFDPDAIGPRLPEVAHDLPAGAKRLKQTADGIKHTVVNGEVLLTDNEHTGATPGRLLRA